MIYEEIKEEWCKALSSDIDFHNPAAWAFNVCLEALKTILFMTFASPVRVLCKIPGPKLQVLQIDTAGYPQELE